MRQFLVLTGALLLTACGGEQYGDLKQELNTMTKDLRGRVDPLPQVKPYEPVPSKAEGEVDPFRPDRINVAAVGGAGTGALSWSASGTAATPVTGSSAPGPGAEPSS